jgi:hypothetical protein
MTLRDRDFEVLADRAPNRLRVLTGRQGFVDRSATEAADHLIARD